MSTPAVGSSRITRRGSCRSARASWSRRRCPARELRRPHVGLGAEVEDVDHLVGPLLGLALGQPEVAAVVDERLAHRQEAVEVRVLLGDPEHPPRLEARRGPAEDQDLALGQPDQVRDRADQGRLARAVRPQQAEERAGGDLEVEALEGEGAVVVALGQPADLERGHIAVAHAGFPSGPHLMRFTRQSRMRWRRAERRQASKKSPWASDASSAPIESRTSLPPSES